MGFLAIVALAVAVTAAPTKLPVLSRTDAPYGIKKGLAYNNGAATNVLSRPGSATWAYNWGTAQDAPLFQQIPMYWGPGDKGDANGVNAKIDRGDTPVRFCASSFLSARGGIYCLTTR